MAFAYDGICYGEFADAAFDVGTKIGTTVGSHVIVDAGVLVDGVSLFYEYDDTSTVAFTLPDCNLWGRGPSIEEWVDFGWMVFEPGLYLMCLAFAWRLTHMILGRNG